MRHAAERARTGQGPTLVVAQTYRVEGHTVGDPLSYRPEGEVDEWRSPARDPISRFARHLIETGGFSEDELNALQQKAREEIGKAVEYAMDSPHPEISALWSDVYA